MRYACLVDATPKLYWEALVFRRAITEVAGVPSEHITIAATTRVPSEVSRRLAGPCASRVVAVAVAVADPCNKVHQLAAPWEDDVAFLDVDMIVLSPLDPPHGDTVEGVPVFGPSPSEAVLRPLYARRACTAARPADWVARTALDGTPFVTHRNHLNGGLYVVPQPLIAPFGSAWADELVRVGAVDGVAPYADQVAAGLALAGLGLTARHREAGDNCPPWLARRRPARAIHDFAKFSPTDRDAAGHFSTSADVSALPERSALASIIDAANADADGATFAAYRRFRYALYADDFALAAREVERTADTRHAGEAFIEDMRTHLVAYRRMRAGG